LLLETVWHHGAFSKRGKRLANKAVAREFYHQVLEL